MRLGIINGPNLNMLGVREPGVYGNRTLDDIIESLKEEFQSDDIIDFQSNDEGELISKVQEWGMSLDGIIINPGGYSHTSIAISDCLRLFQGLIYEVHISNIYRREKFRRFSYLSDISSVVICGLGFLGYEIALDLALTNHK